MFVCADGVWQTSEGLTSDAETYAHLRPLSNVHACMHALVTLNVALLHFILQMHGSIILKSMKRRPEMNNEVLCS